jgi:ABC-2 type transport system ATP-binding protein
MLHEPQLLLLDEPTAGVDPAARRDFWEELHRLAANGISVLVSTHYMDEAERCHKLAYIAYGKLLAQGTADEVVASQNLQTWAIHGERLTELSGRLRAMPGVDQTVVFGAALHASGSDHAALEQSVRAALAGEPQLRAERIDTGLEDVFIHLMQSAPNGKAGAR